MDKQLYYVTYDPEAMWAEMMQVYMDAGGDVLYGGDEKEILLRAMLAIAGQIFAGVDNGIRMATLRYAVRDYLKEYGANRFCPYNEAIAATGTVAITLKPDGKSKTIPAGTVMSADGQRYFQTASAVQHTGAQRTAAVDIQATEGGVGGNGLPMGTLMRLVVADSSVAEIVITKETTGGVAAEDFEVYRERVRTSAMSHSTTGPAEQYEAVTMGASPTVIDARAVNSGPGVVHVNLLLQADAGEQAVIGAVSAALNDSTVRPLTDTVLIAIADTKTYTIKVGYEIASPLKAEEGLRALEQAANEYQAWQDNTIGRAFDPFRLIGMLYQAGASRVVFLPESEFDGGPLEYTEIGNYTHTSGTVELGVLS